MAKPIGSQRAFMSIPAVIAATAPPPAARTLSAANWAAPENTKIDIAIGATGPMTGRASTPKDTPRASVGRTSGSPARTPGAHVAVLVHLGYLTCLRLQQVRQRCRCQPGDDQALGRRAVPGLRQQRGLVARRPAAVTGDRCAAQPPRAGALGPPAGRRARAPAARRGRRRARGRTRAAARRCTASSRRSRRIAGRGGPTSRRSPATTPRRRAPRGSRPPTTAPGAWTGRRPSRAPSASPSRSTPWRCSPTRRAWPACTAARGPRAAGSSWTPAAGGGGARCRRAAAGSRCAGSTRADGRPIAASNVSAR